MDNIPNIDNETMSKIKNLVDNGNLSSAISQISPEMIENFSKMMANNNNKNNINQNNDINSNTKNNSNNSNYNTTTSNTNDYNPKETNNTYTNNNQNTNNTNNQNNENTYNNTANFDLNNIDINTIMKMTSAFGSINNKNDPRSNLLNSLKPYLRDSKKKQLDNYVNLLNMGKIAEVLKNTNINNANTNNNNITNKKDDNTK